MEKKESTNRAERFVKYALRIGALELVLEGCQLKSGRISPYFFNSGKFDSGEAIAKLSAAYARIIRENFSGRFDFTLLYGPPYKGTILVPAVAMMLETLGRGNFCFCTSRKEPKKHGEGGLFIGAPIKNSSRVLIIDDVITDGETKREAVELIRQQGGEPVGLVIAFDRQERGMGDLSAVQEFEREYEIPVHPVAVLTDLISVLGASKYNTAILDKILAYRQEYGVA